MGGEQAIERASEDGRKKELVSCGGGALRQRGACGMAGNAVEGSEWRTCTDGVGVVGPVGGEGREGG
jgi:hypothetical protein